VQRGVDGSLTTGVVAGNDGLVLSDTVDIGLDDSAQEGGIQVSKIVRVAVAGCCDARVDTRGVAVPEIHVDGWDGLASAGVDELDVEVERDTFLIFRDVATDQLTIDVVRALGDFRLQDAGRIILEQKSLVVAVRHAGGRFVRDVVSRKVAADKRAVQAPLDSGLLGDRLTAGERTLGSASALKARRT
jgi:hypothetical protein